MESGSPTPQKYQDSEHKYSPTYKYFVCRRKRKSGCTDCQSGFSVKPNFAKPKLAIHRDERVAEEKWEEDQKFREDSLSPGKRGQWNKKKAPSEGK